VVGGHFVEQVRLVVGAGAGEAVRQDAVLVERYADQPGTTGAEDVEAAGPARGLHDHSRAAPDIQLGDWPDRLGGAGGHEDLFGRRRYAEASGDPLAQDGKTTRVVPGVGQQAIRHGAPDR
jgi:hypothetical protein